MTPAEFSEMALREAATWNRRAGWRVKFQRHGDQLVIIATSVMSNIYGQTSVAVATATTRRIRWACNRLVDHLHKIESREIDQ